VFVRNDWSPSLWKACFQQFVRVHLLDQEKQCPLTFSNDSSRATRLSTPSSPCLCIAVLTPNSQTRIYEIIKDAVEIEKEFITDAIPCRMMA
jgi:hypothetical protein